jgi:hypothetical protein
MALPGRRSPHYLLSLDDRILDILSCNPGGPPFLPKLNHLTVPLDSFDLNAHYPQLVVGKALRSICIDFSGDNFMERLDRCIFPPSLWHNMRFVLSSALGITSFTVDASWDGHFREVLGDFGSQPDLLQLYCSFHHLEEFYARPSRLSHEVLSHLAALPRLKKIMIFIHSTELEKFTLKHPSERVFNSIVEFGIETDSLVPVQNLLKRRGFEMLESLTVSRRPVYRLWEIDPFLDTLRRWKSMLPLKSLTLAQAEFLGGSGFSPVSEIRTFASLVPFTDMRVVEINLNGLVALDNRELGRLADAWPRLQILHLSEWGTSVDEMANVTLRGLLTLAASCPELNQLTLRVNAVHDIPDAAELTNVVPGLKLEYFNTCKSTINDPTKVAEFLHIVFPKLREVCWAWGSNGPNDFLGDFIHADHPEIDYVICWEDVDELLSQKWKTKMGKRSCIREMGM